ncbi:hypothetical protein [Kribbella sp. DT2]|uniref:hypothetical protein n=1 Tax=Kribbella sp. DT2 TaxID=3393427 RepID=UPI003CEDF1CF
MMTQQGPPRAFWLVRSDGGGAVAEGVLWADGVVAVRWCGQGTAVSVWSGGLDALLAGHGRDGSTEVRWTEQPHEHNHDHPEHSHDHHEPPRDQADEPVRRPPYLPAPGVDGRCVRCGGYWPCLDCGF